jgi:hypothetical protein
LAFTIFSIISFSSLRWAYLTALSLVSNSAWLASAFA